MKTQVLEVIGETDWSRLAQIQAALAANDRIKYYLSLLQTAAAQADHPGEPMSWLRRDDLQATIGRRAADDLVSQSQRDNGRYRMPGCSMLLQRIAEDLRTMAAPVLADAEPPQRADLSGRLESLIAKLPSPENDTVVIGA